MRDSLPYYAALFAILVGLVSRIETVVVHEHDAGEIAHHHGDRAYFSYAPHDSSHDHGEFPADDPISPDDDHVPGHSHGVFQSGSTLPPWRVAVSSGHLLDVVACGSTGLVAAMGSPLATLSRPSIGSASPPFFDWPPETTLERRLNGLGLVY